VTADVREIKKLYGLSEVTADDIRTWIEDDLGTSTMTLPYAGALSRLNVKSKFV
jgi:hypothetical protein